MTTVPALWTKNRGLARTISHAYYIPGSDHQDVEQEALIGLWHAARDYQPDKGPFKAFAGCVIRRHLTSCLRAATRQKQQPLNGAARNLDKLPYLHQVTDQAEDRDRLRSVLKAIDADLTDFERHCVVGIASGLSYAEIGTPYKRVDNALVRARQKLRDAA